MDIKKELESLEELAAAGLIDDAELSAKRDELMAAAYDDAKAAAEKARFGKAWKEAAERFERLDDYKDSAERAQQARAKAKEATKKLAIAVAVAVAIIAVALVVTQVVMSAQRKAKLEAMGLPGDIAVGSTVSFGSYEQDNNTSNGKEPIEWQVLAIEGNKVCLLSEKGLDVCFFNSSQSSNNDWDKSYLKSWLQGEFANEAGLSDYANDLTCLSAGEAKKYFSSDSERRCMKTAYADQGFSKTRSWWLLPPSNKQNELSYVDDDGGITSVRAGKSFEGMVVRPALWINL